MDCILDVLCVELYSAGTWILRAWGKAGGQKLVLIDYKVSIIQEEKMMTELHMTLILGGLGKTEKPERVQDQLYGCVTCAVLQDSMLKGLQDQ